MLNAPPDEPMGTPGFPEPIDFEEAPVLTDPITPHERPVEPDPEAAADTAPAPEAVAIADPPRTFNWERWVTVAIVVANTLLLIRVLHPTLLLKDTNATGGDTGAHVLAPDFLRHHLLGKWRLSGWSNDWYAGFPIYQFYMVIPPLVIALLSFLLPYTIAFKLVSVAGLVTMPVAAWAFGRLARLPFPYPALLSAASLPFLFDTGFSILGGNIASTMAGEFNFSVALSLSLVYLGCLIRAWQDGRGWGRVAVLATLTALCHLLVAVFIAAATVAVVLVYGWRRWQFMGRWAMAVAVSLMLSAWWTLPMWVNRKYTIDMGWTKETDYFKFAFPQRMLWVFILAAFGVAYGVRQRNKVVLSMTLWSFFLFLGFRYVPDGRLWNQRLLPGFWLTAYLMAGIGAAAIIGVTVAMIKEANWREWARIAAPAVTAVLAVFYVGLPMIHANDGRPTEFGIGAKQSYLRGWIEGNYRGYEEAAGWPEYSGIMSTMNQVGQDHGCGRAHYEYDASQGTYGTPLAMQLLPYWTEGCITSLEGLYFESSPTTPFNFLIASEVSAKPSNPFDFNKSIGRTDLYRPIDLNYGVPHMQLMGVKYYLAYSDDAKNQAAQRTDLTEVARSGPWVVYEVAGSDLVQGLDHLPYVEKGTNSSWEKWLTTGVALWDKIGDEQFYAAPNGPKDWPRIKKGDDLPNVPVPNPATVSNVKQGDDWLSFDVDQVGKPVLVKMSYFPNWRADGADGPYRVTPNLMVVVPKQQHVRLHYARSNAEKAGIALTVLGFGALGTLVWWERKRRW